MGLARGTERDTRPWRWSTSQHRAKLRVSVFLKRGGNMQLHVSVMFTFCGNVQNSSLRDSVTFPERKCQVTFP